MDIPFLIMFLSCSSCSISALDLSSSCLLSNFFLLHLSIFLFMWKCDTTCFGISAGFNEWLLNISLVNSVVYNVVLHKFQSNNCVFFQRSTMALQKRFINGKSTFWIWVSKWKRWNTASQLPKVVIWAAHHLHPEWVIS